MWSDKHLYILEDQITKYKIASTMQKSPLAPVRDGEMQYGMRSVRICVHIMLLSER